MNVLNTAFTLGFATIGLVVASWLGALAFGHKRRAEQIRMRLLSIAHVNRAYMAYAAPRFLSI